MSNFRFVICFFTFAFSISAVAERTCPNLTGAFVCPLGEPVHIVTDITQDNTIYSFAWRTTSAGFAVPHRDVAKTTGFEGVTYSCENNAFVSESENEYRPYLFRLSKRLMEIDDQGNLKKTWFINGRIVDSPEICIRKK